MFARERDVIAAIKGTAGAPIEPGDVIVLAGRGPLGSGMEETYQLTSALKFLPFGRDVALITDARFSGVSTGACIGHVSPEALEGGPIGRLLDGDLIRVLVDREQLVASIDLVGHGDEQWTAEEAAAELERRPCATTSLPIPALPGGHRHVGAAAVSERRALGWLRVRPAGDRRAARRSSRPQPRSPESGGACLTSGAPWHTFANVLKERSHSVKSTLKTATLHDVAREAGVSVSTVSRALNDQPFVRPEVRERVLSASEALGYRPDVAARSMRTGTTGAVGLVVSDISNPLFASIAKAADSLSARAGTRS